MEKRYRIEAAELRASFIDFLEGAWPEIDPSAFVPGWHFDALGEHLEAVAKGQIRKLLINEPPRHGKSLETSVAFPAWVWAQLRYKATLGPEDDPLKHQSAHPIMGPQTSFMCLSYSGSLAFDHALLMKRLLQSHWYQRRFGRSFRIRDDKTATSKFDTTAGGTRISDSMDGSNTGRGADYRIFDDPHNVKEAESDVVREGVINTYEQALKNRVTDPRQAVEIIVMQRTHERDLSGHVLANDPEFVHLMLPAEFEPERRSVTIIKGEQFWADPRNDDGEVLWPGLWGQAQLDPLKRDEYRWAGQYQQRPAPRDGGLFKPHWFRVVKALPAGVAEWCRGWDLAGTDEKKNRRAAFTAGVMLGKYPDGTLVIADSARGQLDPGDAERLIVNTATQDAQWVRTVANGGTYCLDLPQDPGQAGKAQIRYFVTKLQGFTVYWSPETGSKEVRADPVASQAKIGNILLLDGPWIPTFLKVAGLFPFGAYKDEIDALSRAFARLVKMAPADVGLVGPRILRADG